MFNTIKLHYNMYLLKYNAPAIIDQNADRGNYSSNTSTSLQARVSMIHGRVAHGLKLRELEEWLLLIRP